MNSISKTKTIIICSLITLGLCCLCQSENDSFVATKNWQEIRDGQSIPAGLHVRINLATGKKEAKVLDDKENEVKKDLSTVPEISDESKKSENEENDHDKLKLSNTLVEALKNLPKDASSVEYTPEKFEEIKRAYKSYKELKDSYEGIRKQFKTDFEIISELMSEYKNITKAMLDDDVPAIKPTDLLRVMHHLKQLVHQIDNAVFFVDLGGLDTVILPTLVNQTNLSLKVVSLRILGALMQNNPKAQIKVFEKNFGNYLCQILISSTENEQLSAALYAFGALIRRFPHAQKEILPKPGTKALIAVINNQKCELNIKAKSLSIIADIIREKEDDTNIYYQPGSPSDTALYVKETFGIWLQSNRYCDCVEYEIANRLFEIIEEADIVENVILDLEVTIGMCFEGWSLNPHLKHTLLTIKKRYSESQNVYQNEVAQTIEHFIKRLYLIRDEL